MGRKDDLINSFKDVSDEKKILSLNLIDEFLWLENQLLELRKFPMIKVHPKNKALVKPTPASKLYKEFLQQYNNVFKNLLSLLKGTENEDDSPLMMYLKELNS